jgi:type IV fimbrial biogenesis protein FimT
MRTTQHGFSLIELVVVMSIVGILMAIAVPSYKYVTTANRVSSEVNSLLGDLQFARAEAIKEGQTVTVCASSDGATCSAGATDWKIGWIVFSDVNGDQIVTANTDTVLRMQKALTSGDTFQPNPSVAAVTFNREGFATGLTVGASGYDAFALHNSPSVQAFTRCLLITIVGAMSTSSYVAGTCT